MDSLVLKSQDISRVVKSKGLVQVNGCEIKSKDCEERKQAQKLIQHRDVNKMSNLN